MPRETHARVHAGAGSPFVVQRADGDLPRWQSRMTMPHRDNFQHEKDTDGRFSELVRFISGELSNSILDCGKPPQPLEVQHPAQPDFRESRLAGSPGKLSRSGAVNVKPHRPSKLAAWCEEFG
jgi:hypothetical protein